MESKSCLLDLEVRNISFFGTFSFQAAERRTLTKQPEATECSEECESLHHTIYQKKKLFPTNCGEAVIMA